MKKSQIIIIAVVMLFVGGGGGFYGGMTYQKGKQPAFPGGTFRVGNFNGNGAARNRGGATFIGGGAVRGTVTSISGTTVTVKEANGSSKLVILGGSTAITKSASAAASDVTVGQTIAAFGTSNSDGSVTASTIQLNPAEGFGGAVVNQAPPIQ